MARASFPVGGTAALVFLAFFALLVGPTPSAAAAAPCDPPVVNPIVCENSKQGAPASEWDVVGAGDPSIQGFATDISVDQGQTIRFKVNTTAIDYRLDIYRMGYYGGLGARKVATVEPSATLTQVQPTCLNDTTTGLIDCGNWADSASWAVPADATSGIYFAKLVREDGTAGASHVVFVVRDDDGRSDLVFQTSDTTWQAYNSYGGNSLYTGSPAGRAYKVSYNRPFNTRGVEPYDWVFNAEYPMVRWLERNGYDVSYFTDVDSDRLGAELLEHKAFLSVGHDEYWSGRQRANVEAARAAGVHLAFFSGNEIFWKTRWEPSIDGSLAPHRTLVSYKETHAGAKIDPEPNVWTGTWRDPRFSPPADGGRPENALSGTIFMVNGYRKDAIEVPAAEGKMRFWRNTSIAALAAGETATLPAGTLGYEWDEERDNGARPAGLVRMSSTTVEGVPYLQDHGSRYAPGTATHHLTLYRHTSGALVFGSGTVQWSWGLDDNHDAPSFGGPPLPPDARMQQATVNLFADMGVQPATLQAGLVAAGASTDTTAPTSSVASPTAGAAVAQDATATISGTASDAGGGVVGGVEVSVDGGTTWHPAVGRETWTYNWTPTQSGSVTIKSRAADDSGNIEAPAAGVTVTVRSPDEGAGGPILVVRGASNLYGRYYGEILHSEGLVEFDSTTLANLMARPDPAGYLSPFKVVLLAESSLNGSEEQLFRNYVSGGGSLIAMRPDPDLADLFGLTFVGRRTEASLQFFAVDTTREPGTGIVDVSLQYHGQADNYALNGATAVAHLWNSISEPSSNPAVAVNSVGNGKAAAFAFDLATSVVLTRQGNPAWKDTEGCDGLPEVRPMDMFVRCDGDKWLAPERTRVPQADEAQRLLANLILMLSKQPLPRMWYLPGTHKTLMVNTGDSEDLAGSALDTTIRDANSYGGTFTTYMTTAAINGTDVAMEAGWRSGGNETGVHVWGGGPQDYDTLRNAYRDIANSLHAKYGHGARTARSHTIDWTGWSEMAEIEAEFGTRLDANYYHYPAWLLPFGRENANGYFTGSGLPQRFSDETGAVLPIYQALTEWPDEWFADKGFTANETAQVMKDMFTAARNGYYTAFVNNVHQVRYNGADPITRDWANQIWAYCRDNGIPMWSAEKLLDFLDARNQASFDNLTWDGSTLSFDFRTAKAGQSLTVMLPTRTGTVDLVSITVGGAPATYTTDTIKGRRYAMLTITATSARVVATYAQDTTPPVVSAVEAQDLTDTAATITWSTNEPADSRVDYGTDPSTLSLSQADSTFVTAHSARLTGLTPTTTYYYKVTSRDQAGNMASSAVQSFTTASPRWHETTAADFGDGTFANTHVVNVGDGAVRLAPATLADDFTQPDGPAANWEVWPSSGDLSQTPSWRVSGNVYVHELNETVPTYHPSVLKSSFTPSGDFTLTARQRITQVGGTGGDIGVLGFIFGGQDTENYYEVQYAQLGLGLKIYRRATGQIFTKIGETSLPDPVVGRWYDLRVEVADRTFKVYIDGALQLTATDTAYRPGRIGVLGYEGSRNEYDDVVVTRSGSFVSSGSYTSSVFDAGRIVAWGRASWTSTMPPGTSVGFSFRTGDTPTPDGTWSAFSSVSTSGGAIGGSSRYIQYRAELGTTDTSQSPALLDVTIGYSLQAPMTVTSYPAATVVETGKLKSGTAALLAAEDDRYFQVSSTTSRPRVASWYGSFTAVPKGLGNLRVTYVGKNSRTCAQTVAIWRWSDSTWVQLDTRSVGTTRVTVSDLVPPGTSSDYVGGTTGGEVRVRVRCTDPKSSFVSSGDLMKIDYDSP